MLSANDVEPDAPYTCHCFTCEEGEWLEPELPLVAGLDKTSSYVRPTTLEDFVKAQSKDAYCMRLLLLSKHWVPCFHTTDRGSTSTSQLCTTLIKMWGQ